MNSIKILILLFLLSFFAGAQKLPANEYANIDSRALNIPDSLTQTTTAIAKYFNSNFKTESEKVRAAFIWVATNIEYDVANMFAIDFYEKDEEKITKPLRTGKGICENYAALFHDILSKMGVKSYMIEGYTKQNGFADYIPHVWCGAYVDTGWYMFDPTWGSGYIRDGRFVRKINNGFYKTPPIRLIVSHMPFDYLWQFLNNTISNQEFYEGHHAPTSSKPFFNYADSIRAYESLDSTAQLQASAYRIEKNGVKNSMIFDRLRQVKAKIENDRQSIIVDQANAASSDYNEGVNYYNEFINYRNKQFTPIKPDPQIQNMIDLADDKIKSAKAKLEEIKNPDANTAGFITQLSQSIERISAQVTEQKNWLKDYFKKAKTGRKMMFYEKKNWLVK